MLLLLPPGLSLPPQRLDIDKREDDMIHHQSYLGRDIEVGWMGLFQNPKILLMEADELDIRLGRLQLFRAFNRHRTLHQIGTNIPSNASIRASTYMYAGQDLQNTGHCQHQVQHTRQHRIMSLKPSKINVRAPSALFKHHVCGYHIPIESEYRLFQPMPLDDAHRLWDTTGTAPAVLGDRSHFLQREGGGYGVVNVPSLVEDIRVHVVGAAEYEAHVGDRESETKRRG